METELAWFGLSDKWKVSEMFQQHISKQQNREMSTEERKNVMKQISKLCPDPDSYKQCRNFKFTYHPSSSSSHAPSSQVPVVSPTSLADFGRLESQFPKNKYPASQKTPKCLSTTRACETDSKLVLMWLTVMPLYLAKYSF